MSNKKGFSLIELLVVIAIIGLLSSLAVVNLNSARGKARDAKRVSDVKQLALLIEMAATSNATGAYQGVLPANCDSPGELTVDCDDGTGTFEDQDWSLFYDPSRLDAGTPLDGPCTNDSIAACDYAMGVDNTSVDDYEICFFLEEGAGSVPQGVNSVNKSAVLSPGCSNDPTP